MAKKKVKEIKMDYVKEFIENSKADQFENIEDFEKQLRIVQKKQKEYEATGKSCLKLAENITLTFQFNDEEKIINSIKSIQRDLGLLQDEEFEKEFKEFTPFRLETYHKHRKFILEEKRTYDVLFTNEGRIGTIGTPNFEKLAKFLALSMSGLEELKTDTALDLLFHKKKRS